MGQFTVGQVISGSFPFSDLASHKYRPAVIVAVVDFDDLILCQITSKPYTSSNPIKLTKADFSNGSLPIQSYIRPDKLFTADASLISKVYGELRPAKLKSVKVAIRQLFM